MDYQYFFKLCVTSLTLRWILHEPSLYSSGEKNGKKRKKNEISYLEYKNILSCCFSGFCLEKQCCSRFIMQSRSLSLSFQRILSCPTINSTGSTSSAPDAACGVPCRAPGLLLVYTLSFRLTKLIAFGFTVSQQVS